MASTVGTQKVFSCNAASCQRVGPALQFLKPVHLRQLPHAVGQPTGPNACSMPSVQRAVCRCNAAKTAGAACCSSSHRQPCQFRGALPALSARQHGPIRRHNNSNSTTASRTARGPAAAGAAAGTIAEQLAGMDDVQRAQQGQDWGYDRLGAPLPEGVSLTALANQLPPSVFTTDAAQAATRAACSLALMAAGYAWLAYMHSICPLWQQLVCWLAVGTGYFGLFQLAADAAHSSSFAVPCHRRCRSPTTVLIRFGWHCYRLALGGQLLGSS
jgi:hypothetical protein